MSYLRISSLKFIFHFFLFSNFLFAEELNINFKDLKISELINISAKILNKNILVTHEIEGRVNFISNKSISKKELRTILFMTLKEKGYTLIQKDNILKIVKIKKNSSNIKTNRKKELDKKRISLKKDILFVKKLKHIEASVILNIIKDIIKSTKSKYTNTFVSLDEANNSIILIASKKEIKFFDKLIIELDKERIQVYVKAKIIEVNDDLLNNIGIKYGILAASSKNSNLITFSSSLNAGNAFSFDPSQIGLSIPNINSGLALGASLNLLRQDYALDIVSQPSLLCLNNSESSIYVGETISILTGKTTNSSGTSNSYIREDIGLNLSVKPRVMGTKVVLQIKASIEGVKTTITASGNADTSKKQIQTTAIVNNGESVILGGLIQEKNEKSKDSIPFLSEIPILGNVFQNTINKKSLKNLIIIITPYIIPQNKDLTYITEQLAKLNILENKFLEASLKKLKNRDKLKSKDKDYALIHKKHLELIYGKNALK